MPPRQRELLEERLAEFRQAKNDPWRLLRCLEAGNDPAICQAYERQIEALIDEMEADLTADLAKDEPSTATPWTGTGRAGNGSDM